MSRFSCGDKDLDDFFHQDALPYAYELLGKTYVVALSDAPKRAVAMLTLANASIRSDLMPAASRNKLQRPIPNAKRTMRYPAVLIGRLGVSASSRGRHIGSRLIELIKYLVRQDAYLTACRFLVVDAYNDERTIHFYAQNGFRMLYADEQLERKAAHISFEEQLKTRMMYFDLLRH